MNVCFVCHEYPPAPHGGIGTMTQVLGRALVDAGLGVRVVGAYSMDGSQPARADDGGVDVWRLPRPTGRFGWVKARTLVFRTVRRWVRSGEVDLIEVPDWQGSAAGWPRLNAPVVCRLHGSQTYFSAEMGRSASGMTRWFEGASLRRADFWCAVSRYTADKTQSLFKLTSGPSAILHNAVELPAVPLAERGRDRIVFSGTLTAKKGVIPLVNAWRRVATSRPRAELHIFGKDTYLEDGRSMQNLLESSLPAGLRPSVTFHGHVPREVLLNGLTTARAAVFPSYAEALPLAPLEAMAHGCPTIASVRGSGPEVIEHGRDGLLVDPDRPDDIADALLQLLADDALATRLGAAGRARVAQTFSVDASVEDNLNFYRDCVRTFHHRGPASLGSEKRWRDA